METREEYEKRLAEFTANIFMSPIPSPTAPSPLREEDIFGDNDFYADLSSTPELGNLSSTSNLREKMERLTQELKDSAAQRNAIKSNIRVFEPTKLVSFEKEMGSKKIEQGKPAAKIEETRAPSRQFGKEPVVQKSDVPSSSSKPHAKNLAKSLTAAAKPKLGFGTTPRSIQPQEDILCELTVKHPEIHRSKAQNMVESKKVPVKTLIRPLMDLDLTRDNVKSENEDKVEKEAPKPKGMSSGVDKKHTTVNPAPKRQESESPSIPVVERKPMFSAMPLTGLISDSDEEWNDTTTNRQVPTASKPTSQPIPQVQQPKRQPMPMFSAAPPSQDLISSSDDDWNDRPVAQPKPVVSQPIEKKSTQPVASLPISGASNQRPKPMPMFSAAPPSQDLISSSDEDDFQTPAARKPIETTQQKSSNVGAETMKTIYQKPENNGVSQCLKASTETKQYRPMFSAAPPSQDLISSSSDEDEWNNRPVSQPKPVFNQPNEKNVTQPERPKPMPMFSAAPPSQGLISSSDEDDLNDRPATSASIASRLNPNVKKPMDPNTFGMKWTDDSNEKEQYPRSQPTPNVAPLSGRWEASDDDGWDDPPAVKTTHQNPVVKRQILESVYQKPGNGGDSSFSRPPSRPPSRAQSSIRETRPMNKYDYEEKTWLEYNNPELTKKDIEKVWGKAKVRPQENRDSRQFREPRAEVRNHHRSYLLPPDTPFDDNSGWDEPEPEPQPPPQPQHVDNSRVVIRAAETHSASNNPLDPPTYSEKSNPTFSVGLQNATQRRPDSRNYGNLPRPGQSDFGKSSIAEGMDQYFKGNDYQRFMNNKIETKRERKSAPTIMTPIVKDKMFDIHKLGLREAEFVPPEPIESVYPPPPELQPPPADIPAPVRNRPPVTQKEVVKLPTSIHPLRKPDPWKIPTSSSDRYGLKLARDPEREVWTCREDEERRRVSEEEQRMKVFSPPRIVESVLDDVTPDNSFFRPVSQMNRFSRAGNSAGASSSTNYGNDANLDRERSTSRRPAANENQQPDSSDGFSADGFEDVPIIEQEVFVTEPLASSAKLRVLPIETVQMLKTGVEEAQKRVEAKKQAEKEKKQRERMEWDSDWDEELREVVDANQPSSSSRNKAPSTNAPASLNETIDMRNVSQMELNTTVSTGEDIDYSKLTDAEASKILNDLYEGSLKDRFKPDYPFLVEGLCHKNAHYDNTINVFTARLGKVHLPDSPERKSKDYVYFLAVRPGVYKACSFYLHPPCLISTKFPKVDEITVRGYALFGASKKDSGEKDWICWNDSLGLMRVVTGSDRVALKKHQDWNMTLDLFNFYAKYENDRFIVTTVTKLTNEHEKAKGFPECPFLLTDLVYHSQRDGDHFFYSSTLKVLVQVKNALVRMDINRGTMYHGVVVPTFPGSLKLVYRAIFLEDKGFWKQNPHLEDTKNKFAMATERYRASSIVIEKPARLTKTMKLPPAAR